MDLREPMGRWRVLALVVGTLLVVLVFIGVPLRYAAGSPGVEKVVGVTHGFLYIVYVLASLDLARRARWSWKQLALAVLAGLVPVMTFVVERRVARGRVLT